jgi:hypothetical protein
MQYPTMAARCNRWQSSSTARTRGFYALDAKILGALSFNAGTGINAPPITYP